VATEIHIAGADVEYDGRYLVQRCAWCGAVILAFDYTRTAVAGNEWSPPATWPVGELVRFTYDGPVASFGEVTLTRTVMELIEPRPEKVPEDACMRAIPFELMVPDS
jgi:hypothetical protein